MLIFVLCSNSGDQLSWSIDSNPICNPSPTKKMKCLFLYYIILLMISQAGRWTQSPSTTPLQPKNEMLIFGLHLTSDDWPGWSLDSNPIHLLSEAKQNEVLIFGLRLTSDDQPGWLMNLNPICLPSPAKKMKCSFLDYVQLLMIGWAGQWTRTPSATCLQPKKWNAYFWITFNFWSLAWLVDGLEPHLPPLSRHKMKCSFLHYVQLLMIGWAGWWTQTQSTTLLQQKNEMLIVGL